MERTRFVELAKVAEVLAAESGRLKKRAAIAAALAGIVGEPTPQNRELARPVSLEGSSSESLLKARLGDAGLFCLYLAGQPFAEADPRKLNAGGALLTKALKEVSGCTDAALTAAYRRHGDMGSAAFEVMPKDSGEAAGDWREELTLVQVAAAFEAMAAARTTAVRAAAVEGLLRRATALEAKYLLKLMLNDMRIGVKQSLIEEAIAVAASSQPASSQPTSQTRDMGHPVSSPASEENKPVLYASTLVRVRHAVMLEADLARAAERAFSGTLDAARMQLFHPLGFMLASPVETPEEAVARFTGKSDAAPAGKKQVLGSTHDQAGETEGASSDEANAESPPVTAQPAEIHAFLEDKYDGMRAQVHCGDLGQPGRVAVYSRNREDITESYPEIVEAFAGVTEPLILDGELLGWDFAVQKALPFSVLGQRIGRKRVDSTLRRAVPVVFMAFDLLFEQAELLLPLPLRERRARLEAVVTRLAHTTVAALEAARAQGMLFALNDEDFPSAAKATTHAVELTHGLKPVPFKAPAEPVLPPGAIPSKALAVTVLRDDKLLARLMLSPAKLVESAEAIDRAYGDARARANEGVMLKAAGSAYLPGRRGLAWVKLKRELATLDVVITGAEFGHGRRAGLLSDYTFAVRGPAGADGALGELLNVGKAYSGVTDVEIAELTAWLQAHTLEDFGHFRTVEPLRVLEVAFNNVMRSDRHASGFALRFPRILRIRDDKPLDEIDTLERVEAIYQSQPDKGRG